MTLVTNFSGRSIPLMRFRWMLISVPPDQNYSISRANNRWAIIFRPSLILPPVPLSDTTALAQECDELHHRIGGIFKGLDRNNELIVYYAVGKNDGWYFEAATFCQGPFHTERWAPGRKCPRAVQHSPAVSASANCRV